VRGGSGPRHGMTRQPAESSGSFREAPIVGKSRTSAYFLEPNVLLISNIVYLPVAWRRGRGRRRTSLLFMCVKSAFLRKGKAFPRRNY